MSNFSDKSKYISKVTDEIDALFNRLAKELSDEVIDKFADKLDKKDGKIEATERNINLIASIENIYNSFSASNLSTIISLINTGFNRINAYNIDYFSTYADGNDYAATTQKIQKIIRDRLGITADGNGKTISLMPGGYMDSMLKDSTVKNQIKNFSYNEVLKSTGFDSFKTGLKTLIAGNNEVMGGFQQYFRNYAYDIFVKIDRHESTLLATDLDLKYFFYEGTIIDTSREFCKERAGKLFSIKEANKWVDDPWIKQAFKKGYIASYDPTTDMGLWSCRHIPRYVSKEVAYKLRPELKDEK